MKTFLIVAVTGVTLFATARPSDAQNLAQGRPLGPRFSTPDRPPATEIGFHLGVWALEDGGGDFGLRVTRNRSTWFGLEYGFAYRPGQQVRPSSGVGLVNARLSLAHPSQPGLGFVSLGLAAGNSASWSISPMGGFGVQFTPVGHFGGQDSFLMIRVELQYFARGKHLSDRGRFMISFVGSMDGRW